MSAHMVGGSSYRPGGPVHIEGAERTDWVNGERLAAGPMSVQGMRDIARAAGLDLGRDDDEARTARHEAGHAAAAFALGWEVEVCDARAGETRFVFPDIMSQSIVDRQREYGVIAASGAEFCGHWVDDYNPELANDRAQLSDKCGDVIDWETARKSAAKLAAEPWVKGIYNRLLDALLVRGRLDGAELQRVLNG